MAAGRSLAVPAWALLAVFVVYASAGTWTADGSRIWAPIEVSWPDVAQNVLLYIPFGILGVFTLRYRRHSLVAPVLEVALIAGLLSLFVEVIQLHTIERTASLTDVVAGVVGAVAGGLAAERVAGTVARTIDAVRPSGVLDAPDTPLLIVLMTALVIAAWLPFDPTLDVSTLAGRWRIIRRDPWQANGVATAAQALLYAWLTLVTAACAYRLRTRQAMLAGASVALASALVIDAGQLAMGSRPIGLAGAAAQITGTVFGAAAFVICRVPK